MGKRRSITQRYRFSLPICTTEGCKTCTLQPCIIYRAPLRPNNMAWLRVSANLKLSGKSSEIPNAHEFRRFFAVCLVPSYEDRGNSLFINTRRSAVPNDPWLQSSLAVARRLPCLTNTSHESQETVSRLWMDLYNYFGESKAKKSAINLTHINIKMWCGGNWVIKNASIALNCYSIILSRRIIHTSIRFYLPR